MNTRLKSRLTLLLLPFVFALQWLVPLLQVAHGESILRDGIALRLELEPVDPLDVLRGRYLALAFPEERKEHILPPGVQGGDTIYVVLEADKDGFARISRLSHNARDGAFAYRIPAQYKAGDKITIKIPLTRYYLPEEDAVKIDELFRWRSDGTPRSNASLGVRIKDGQIVAESLWIDGQPYRDWLHNYQSTQTAGKQQTP
ncbi:GDYXXLXY domain-containing protein [uncultured Cardiobacterium sp.]|uniref:GDYXXLXY domain-containing protein n=1 Tax=uncultured Cardiobacterium sp. TaxID=417619 RepID=UPI00260FE9ED|nr:GDYXXLXY domain-containing protein [uncultured Cardiobacterium sp.]